MTTKTERDLNDGDKRIVHGVKGVKSTYFTRTFANAKAMDKWLDENEGNVEVYTIEKA